MVEKYSTVRVAIILAFILCVSYAASTTDPPPKSQSEYEKWVDSLYQINIQISKDYAESLAVNPKAVRPEPAIWFLDFDGNMYDYPPIKENDSILKKREEYQRKLDSFQGRQFKDLDRWNQTTFNKK